MPQIELSKVKKAVMAAAKKTAIGESLEDVRLEPVQDDEGFGFLRITFFVKKLNKIDDEKLTVFVRTIEKAVTDKDDRFPSIRFC